MPDLRCCVEAPFRLDEVTGRLALDQVARHGEGASAEPDQGLLRVEAFPHEAHRVQHERHRLVGVGHAQPLDVRERLDRPLDDRADVLDQIHVDSHPEDGQHDVGEHHRRVDAVQAHRLERHLGAELGLAEDLEQPVLLADLPVPGQRPPRLAHEPDRRPLDGLEAAGSDEERRGHGGRLVLELRGELVVDPAEDERGDRERGGRRLRRRKSRRRAAAACPRTAGPESPPRRAPRGCRSRESCRSSDAR